ncbi:MAG: molybdopterin dehydrogenase [Porticoccaceae bacterium]|nr:molybdopterin dehydrogenase [Porticoccaceae bacterium]
MKASAFSYHKPNSLIDALELLQNEEDAKVLAGGQSLMPMLNMRFVQPETVIDVNGLEELASISFTENLEIGALTRQKTLAADPIIKQHLPIMQEALTWVGHFQTQSRGTIGGSLCHLDPASELPMVALLYDAELQVASVSGTRLIPMQEWALAYMMPSIGPDELLTKIIIKPWQGVHGYGFQEFARRHGDFAIAAVGCLLKLDNNIITDIALSIGGVEDVPRRFLECEDRLRGMTYDIEEIKTDVLEPLDQINYLDDSLVTGTYRRRLLKGLLIRAIEQAALRV